MVDYKCTTLFKEVYQSRLHGSVEIELSLDTAGVGRLYIVENNNWDDYFRLFLTRDQLKDMLDRLSAAKESVFGQD